jgi:outer membrane protein OmpA-like peptidoglycan-associated protein
MKRQLFVCLACASIAAPLLAQTPVPTPEQMIEKLSAPRLRSLRNLSVQTMAPPTQAEEVRAERPSLSLQIQFDFNSSKVRPESQQALVNLAQALKAETLASYKFAVEGHTDAAGKPDYNQKLSSLRAFAVRDFLSTQGIDEARIVPAGKGSTELANTSDPMAAENRRVRIVNLN